ncbi:hypothetical protein ATANTOWER_021418 [Ataeniobius toweri]|uniref:Uncharacterized protein n=1 Tax=Ataeniobius toweri TaxID=208326 RepID=A0ABU7ATX5_9TELE|nr:hypothetical protein [Ataeniobius toweri]
MPEESVNNVLVSERKAFSLRHQPRSHCEVLTGSLHVVALHNTCLHFSMSVCFKRIERKKGGFSTTAGEVSVKDCLCLGNGIHAELEGKMFCNSLVHNCLKSSSVFNQV